jgi:hypothetical protein
VPLVVRIEDGMLGDRGTIQPMAGGRQEFLRRPRAQPLRFTMAEKILIPSSASASSSATAAM